MDFLSNFHAVRFSAFAASSNIAVGNWRRSNGLFMQEDDSWRCATDVKSSREHSQKSKVHWLCPSWPIICLIFSVAGISIGRFRSLSGRLPATAHTRFGHSLKSLVALWTASTIFVGGGDCASISITNSNCLKPVFLRMPKRQPKAYETRLPVTGARPNGVAAVREIEMMSVLYEHKNIVHTAAIQRKKKSSTRS
jgi:hypothetical protein